MMVTRRLLPPAMVLGTWLLAACERTTTGPQDMAEVTLGFASPGEASAATPTIAPLMSSVEVPGSNGLLVIDEVQMVVDEFKLEGDEGACEVSEESGFDGCVQFEAPPYFADLPLDVTPVDVASVLVPDGIYTGLKLETKSLESSASVADEVLALYPDWPASTSLRVVGSFDPQDGSGPTPFVVYFHAEVKVELAFDAPHTVAAADETTYILVEIDPSAWFVEDGTVVDLSQYDFDPVAEGPVVDFEAKMSNGFTKIEVAGS